MDDSRVHEVGHDLLEVVVVGQEVEYGRAWRFNLDLVGALHGGDAC
jgi:hypothetical protein